MNYLSTTKRSLSLVPSKKIRSQSGKEILETTISVADEMDRTFDPNWLYDIDFMSNSPFCKSGRRKFSEFVSRSLKNLGIETRLIRKKQYEPIFGWASQHNPRNGNEVTKATLEPILEKLKFFDHDLYKRTQDKNLIGVEYSLINPWENINYFREEWIPEWLLERGFPNIIVPALSKAYIKLQKIKGMKDWTNVEQEIFDLFKDNQVNPDECVVLGINHRPTDLFTYNNRYFKLARKTDGVDHVNNPNLNHNVTSLELLYGFALYSNEVDKPIAYTLFKSGSRPLIETKERLRIV